MLASRECPDGEKCNVWANNESNEWNATRCSPMPEQTFPPGAPCTMEYSQTSGFDDCAHGSTCWDTDPTSLVGTCRAFCDPEDSEACGDEDQHCAILHEEVFALCLTSCNPLEPSACGPGEGCRFVLSAGGPYCVPLDGGVVTDSGMICAEGSCDVDSMCLPADWVPGCRDEECCTPWCDLNDLTDSVCTAIDPSMYCVPLYGGGVPPKGPLVGLEAVGFCAIQPE